MGGSVLRHLPLCFLPNNVITYFVHSSGYDSQIAVTTFETGTSYYFFTADVFHYVESIRSLLHSCIYSQGKLFVKGCCYIIEMKIIKVSVKMCTFKYPIYFKQRDQIVRSEPQLSATLRMPLYRMGRTQTLGKPNVLLI